MDVHQTIFFKRYCGQEYDLQDLQWRHPVLSNCATRSSRRFQPTNTVRSLTSKLSNTHIGTMKGKNAMRACSLICGIHDRLKLMGKVPHDIIYKLMRVFQTTSVDKFNQLFFMLSYYKDLGLVSLNLLTVSKLVKLAKTNYVDLLVEGDWTGAGAFGSSFVMKQMRKSLTFL
jgi:hypothetical protein